MYLINALSIILHKLYVQRVCINTDVLQVLIEMHYLNADGTVMKWSIFNP